MTFDIAAASADDVQRMAQWAADEGWDPGNTDALAFFCTDPGGFLMGYVDGQPQVCISVVKYGQTFGFLGFYIARPGVRGKGYGIQIWRAGMQRLEGRNVGLDGVVAQQYNYRKSGFRLAWNNIRHQGAPVEAGLPAGVSLFDARRVPFAALATYDRRFFPDERDTFLAAWISVPERAAMVAVRDGALAGFGVMRNAAGPSRIGPLYAKSPEIANALIAALAKELGATSVTLDVPDVNRPAVRLAEQIGLKPAFEVARMYTGKNPDVDLAAMYGVTSFELG
jgi:ribosomal protein S18 acetylase RimI-like enzyme